MTPRKPPMPRTALAVAAALIVTHAGVIRPWTQTRTRALADLEEPDPSIPVAALRRAADQWDATADERRTRSRSWIPAATLNPSFELLDFEAERTSAESRITEAAEAAGLALPDSLALPRHDPDSPRPQLQWGRLELASRLLTRAAETGLDSVSAAEWGPERRTPAGETPAWIEFRARLDVSGPPNAVWSFLNTPAANAESLPIATIHRLVVTPGPDPTANQLNVSAEFVALVSELP